MTEPGLIVDAGSGPGVVSCLFAEAFPGARVVAVDATAPLLERARDRAARQGVADRFDTLAGELPEVLDELGTRRTCCGRVAVCTTSVTSGPRSPRSPSGSLPAAPSPSWRAVCPPLPAPGHRHRPPRLQARLDALEEEWFARMRADLPGSVAETEDWPALPTAAGLKAHPHPHLPARPARPPPPDQARAYVAAHLSRLREGIGEELDADDRATLDRLLDPSDPASVHVRPDVFVLGAYTVHTAVRRG